MIALSSRELGVVKDILHRHISDREVWVFGSRAGKDHKKYSDLDLAIIGREPIPPQVMAILAKISPSPSSPLKSMWWTGPKPLRNSANLSVANTK